jgi:cytochrome c5
VADAGDGPVLFRFQMKNVSQEPVVIEQINVSCGCTTVDARAMPFSLAPGDSENIQVRMYVTGKLGSVTKSLLVQGSRASWTLLVTAEVASPAVETSGAATSSRSRAQNIELAKADRQAVFRGDCARCHSRVAEESLGHKLYLGACAICHDAEHRASMVPDLRAVGEPRDAAHWRRHITDGLEGTLMPAFALAKGGILSDEQIESLVLFLVESPLELKPSAPNPIGVTR